jgi:uncharacterized membrane protein (TIGR02234 family)
MNPARRQFSLVLLAGAAGAALVLLAVRQEWARAVFTPPQPLPQQVISVTGQDLVPVAGALGLAALACLAAVIATRGVARRVAGVVLALFGAGAGAAAATVVTAAQVISVAGSRATSPASAAASGGSGSTTGGTSSPGGAVVISGSAARAIMTGTPWRAAVIIGALVIVAAGVATAMRGPAWPVMSARYDAPGTAAAPASVADGSVPAIEGDERALDSASIWESLSSGTDPTSGSPH